LASAICFFEKYRNTTLREFEIGMSTNRFTKIIQGTDENLIYGGDLSKYGKDFQIKLLALLIKDRVFSISILPIIKHEYFSDIYLKKIFNAIQEYITEYPSSTPSIDNLKILLQNKKEKIQTYQSILENINTIDLGDRDFVINNARRFCFSKHALAENDKIKILLEEGKFEEAQKISIDSFKFSGLSTRKIYDLKADYEKIYQDDVLHRPVPLPFESFNKISKGGPGSGNLIISVAFSNFGKTAALTAYARHANLLGKNVAFFSFEIGGVDIIRRYIAGLTEEKQENLKYQKSKVKERIVDENLGNFRLIEERATLATVDNIKNDLEYLKSTGFFPDVIMVDSLNQLKVTGKKPNDNNEKFEKLSEELRDLANEYGIPVHTVFQTNRSGAKSELNDTDTIGKAIEPFQVADMVWTFTQPPECLSKGTCLIYLIKNRLGPKGIVIEAEYDPNMGLFKEIGDVSEILLLNDKDKKQVKSSVLKTMDKLKSGEFDKK